ncbi:MAG TPA: aminoglycoside phosphotransferase family protein [Anaerolineales bacterium]|nr:aminoglycoside phosphotransferase family protein [Anaerolineales bacterium]
MNLPPDFIQTMQSVFGEEGRIFLENLPNLIEQASTRWGLTDVQPVSNLSFNFAAFAKRGGEEVILKMGIPNRELTSEMAALKLFNGDGACQLLECDEERGFLLLERLVPGRMLSELEDDDERTLIAAEVMSKLWREVPSVSPAQGGVLAAGDGGLSNESSNKFIRLSDWFAGLKKIRPHFKGGTGPFPKEILERVESFLPELFADKNVKLMHGDFHHYNILKSDRGWLVIDPKGVIGPVGYEIGPLMINPWDSISDWSQFNVRAERRVSILAERLGWEREKIINWSTAHAILSAWWSIEDGVDHEYAMQCAEIFSELK